MEKELTGIYYRGYYIRSNHRGEFWVEKNTEILCYATSLEEAKRKVDLFAYWREER